MNHGTSQEKKNITRYMFEKIWNFVMDIQFWNDRMPDYNYISRRFKEFAEKFSEGVSVTETNTKVERPDVIPLIAKHLKGLLAWRMADILEVEPNANKSFFIDTMRKYVLEQTAKYHIQRWIDSKYQYWRD